MATVSTLQLTFETTGGSKSTISVTEPKLGLDAETVDTEMGNIIDADVFETKYGKYESANRAQYVERTVTELFSEDNPYTPAP